MPSPIFALHLKVRPTPPTLSNVQLSAQEGENITATCTANLGYPRPLQIVWKTYQNGRAVDLSTELIVTAVNITQPGDDSCTVRSQSTVSLEAIRIYQNLTLACFVTNQDFQPSAPDFCKDPNKDLCSQTDAVIVSYPVTSIKLTQGQSGLFYEGSTVALKCYSDGHPLPTYTWTKVGDENRTLTTVTYGLYSILIISTDNANKDSGEYNCTASNTIQGVTYRVADVISLIINLPTTMPVQTSATQVKTTDLTKLTAATITSSSPKDESCSNTPLIATAIILSTVIVSQLIFNIVLIKRNKGNLFSRNMVRKKQPAVYHIPDNVDTYDHISDNYYKSLNKNSIIHSSDT